MKGKIKRHSWIVFVHVCVCKREKEKEEREGKEWGRHLFLAEILYKTLKERL